MTFAFAAKYGIHLVSLLRIVNGTQRVKERHVPVSPIYAVFERVPSVELPVVGDLHLGHGPQSQPVLKSNSLAMVRR